MGQVFFFNVLVCVVTFTNINPYNQALIYKLLPLHLQWPKLTEIVFIFMRQDNIIAGFACCLLMTITNAGESGGKEANCRLWGAPVSPQGFESTWGSCWREAQCTGAERLILWVFLWWKLMVHVNRNCQLFWFGFTLNFIHLRLLRITVTQGEDRLPAPVILISVLNPVAGRGVSFIICLVFQAVIGRVIQMEGGSICKDKPSVDTSVTELPCWQAAAFFGGGASILYLQEHSPFEDSSSINANDFRKN